MNIILIWLRVWFEFSLFPLTQREHSMCPFNMKIGLRRIMNGLISSHLASEKHTCVLPVFSFVQSGENTNSRVLLFTIDRKRKAFKPLAR